MLNGAVTVCPSADFTVTAGGEAGPLPVVVTDSFQRAPVPLAVSVASPRSSGPLVVLVLTRMLLPLATVVVPAMSQVQRLLLRTCTLALLT
jgi:hypothetical protein